MQMWYLCIQKIYKGRNSRVGVRLDSRDENAPILEMSEKENTFGTFPHTLIHNPHWAFLYESGEVVGIFSCFLWNQSKIRKRAN